MNRRYLALTALGRALQLRQSLRYEIWNPVCPYDSAQSMGIEVRFVDISTLEAIYVKVPRPVILISSLRPSGRAVYNCAHEIGHHVFNHGTRVDQDLSDIYDARNDSDEFLAQVFAGYFLMPKSAVEAAFARRSWNINLSDPVRIFTVANWLGVGYETLINHMQFSLRILEPRRADYLRKTRPREIKAAVLGQEIKENLIIVDYHWTGHPIDVEIGDFILFWPGIKQIGNQVQLVHQVDGVILYKAIQPGIGRFDDPRTGWSSILRVAKRGFSGRNIFRYLADPEFGQA